MEINAEAKLDFVIVGGESGPGFREMKPEWAIVLRDQCVAAGIPFFFKQHSGVHPKSLGDFLDGRQWHEFPKKRLRMFFAGYGMVLAAGRRTSLAELGSIPSPALWRKKNV